MAQIDGSVGKNNYSFYGIFTETIPADYIETNRTEFTLDIYIKNNGTRFNSNNWKKYLKVDGTECYNDSGLNINSTTVGYYESLLLMTVTGSIPHNADGSKRIIIESYIEKSTSYSSYDPGRCYLYGEIDLTRIPRTSSVSGGSGNIGSSTTIYISRASDSFTHDLYWSFGGLSGLIASGVGSSYNWTIPTSLFSQIPNSNSGIGSIICNTYLGSTYIGQSTCNFTANVVNSNPIFSSSNISYLDSNSVVTAITGNNQHIVRNQSNLQVSFSDASAQNSASISKYEITLNGGTQTKYAGSTIDYGKLNVSNNIEVSIKVTDSRGNSTTAKKTITILDWILPIASILLSRLNNYEDETYLTVTGKISSVNSKNAIQSIIYRYKKTSESTYSNDIGLNNNEEVTISMDKSFAWNFQIVITDKFGSTTYNLILPKGQPILFIDTKKLSVGVNTFPTVEEGLEINGGLYIQVEGVAIPIIEVVDE